jgi:hypothetical protein
MEWSTVHIRPALRHALFPTVRPALRLAASVALGLSLLAPGATMVAPAQAASALLESVKQNPQLARQLCAEFKQLNAEGRSATSPESLARVASSQGLSTMDAEVLTTYVIGLYCPDVR